MRKVKEKKEKIFEDKKSFEEGVNLFEKKDYLGAISKFTEAIKLSSDYLADIYTTRGIAYEDLQNYE